MNFLIVGGAGYVGSHMVKLLLDRGHAVTVFDNLSRGHRDAALSADLVEGDLLNPAALQALFSSRKFDVVAHFAALCNVGESVSHPRSYFRNNVVGTMNLLDAMLDVGIRKFVFSSTCSTYGNPLDTPIHETHPQVPINPYGASKLMVERVLHDYEIAYGLDSVSLRYFNAAGCHAGGGLGERHNPETHLIPLVLLEAARVRGSGDPAETRLLVNGADYPTADGTCVRDYVHVDDLAAAHLASAERMINGALQGARAFNLGTGKGHSVFEVIESCRRITGVPVQYRVGPRRAGDPPILLANADASAQELAWHPTSTLDEMVSTAWRWFGDQTRRYS